MFWRKKTPKIVALPITDQTFNEVVTGTDLPILVDFWAGWCGPCKVIGPIIDELAGDFKDRAVVAKVNVEQNPGLSAHFKIKSIPTLMIINRGEVREIFKSLIPKPNLTEILEEYIAENAELDRRKSESSDEEE